jgi:hypothetical protein
MMTAEVPQTFTIMGKPLIEATSTFFIFPERAILYVPGLVRLVLLVGGPETRIPLHPLITQSSKRSYSDMCAKKRDIGCVG